MTANLARPVVLAVALAVYVAVATGSAIVAISGATFDPVLGLGAIIAAYAVVRIGRMLLASTSAVGGAMTITVAPVETFQVSKRLWRGRRDRKQRGSSR